jgi:DNA primase
LLLENICQFFENHLLSNSGSEALQYLYSRGLNNSNIKKFRLGFAPLDANLLLDHLKSKSFSNSELLASGIIGQNSNGNLYNKFRNRVIFPITNLKGIIIAFGGRILGEGQPKYLNSSETNLFKKGHNLYNFSGARKSIYDQKFAVVVEGYMDAISLSINGVENVVAPLGTALTLDQIQILWRSTDDIVVCLDGDSAGLKAMRRTIDVVLPSVNPKHLIRFALLPDKIDPDDFIRKNGKAVMQNFLQNASNLSKVLFDFEAKDLDLNHNLEGLVSPEKKAMLEDKLFKKVNLISDASSKKHFSQYYRNLLYELGKNKKFQSKKITSKTSINHNFDLDSQDIYSIYIISYIVTFPELKDYQDEFCVLRNLEFKNQELSNIKEHLINFLDRNQETNFVEIKSELEIFIQSEEIKRQIFSNKFANDNLEKIRYNLQISLLRYLCEEVSLQYRETLSINDEIKTDEISFQPVLKDGKQKELFNYKTYLEKKILDLINEPM